jgi:hypothetical protein
VQQVRSRHQKLKEKKARKKARKKAEKAAVQHTPPTSPTPPPTYSSTSFDSDSEELTSPEDIAEYEALAAEHQALTLTVRQLEAQLQQQQLSEATPTETSL